MALMRQSSSVKLSCNNAALLQSDSGFFIRTDICWNR